jgi:hypothetical protein
MARSSLRNIWLFAAALLTVAVAPPALANPGLTAEWPEPAAITQIVPEDVALDSARICSPISTGNGRGRYGLARCPCRRVRMRRTHCRRW